MNDNPCLEATDIDTDTGADSEAARAEVIARLFAEHNQSLIRFLRSRLRSTEEAADVAQEAYVRMLRLDSPGGVNYMRAYLFSTAANIAIDRLRSRPVEARRALQFFDASAAESLTPEKELSDAEEVRLVTAYIEELPPTYREALLLYRFDSLTIPEVGARMGIPERTVRRYIADALGYCQARLDRAAPPKRPRSA